MIDLWFPHVTDVRHVRDHVLWLRFSDGVEGTVDFAGRLQGPMFEPLSDPAYFAQVRVERYTIEWPNGLDIAPESLYERLEATGAVAKRPYQQLLDDAAAREAAEVRRVPEISRFFGIVIRMFATEHSPPHFHAEYAEYVAAIGIRDARVRTRGFPGRALRLLLEWRELHERELLENWERMRRGEQPKPIEPLE